MVLDLVGACVWIGLMFVVLRTARSPDEVAPMRDLLLLAAASYMLARLVTQLHAWAAPAMVAGCASLAGVSMLGDADFGPTSDPLGYSNASAALLLVGCGAALVVVARAPAPQVRAVAIGGAIICGLVPWMVGAYAAGLLALVLPLALMARQLGIRVHQVAVAAAVVVLLAVGATAAIGAVWTRGGPIDVMVASTLSGNRAMLWQDSVELLTTNPLHGVGPNRFSAESPTARSDRDLRWAHSEYLQLGAETGVPGLTLGLALTLWLIARPLSGQRDRGTAVTIASLATTSIAASIDYVWHFPVVVIATMTVAGAAGGKGRSILRDREPRIGATLPGDAVWPQQLRERPRQDPQVELD